MRHDHVIRVKHSRNAYVSKLVSLNHPYRFNPITPTFRRRLLLLFVLPLSLKVIVVLQQDPPLSPTFRKLLICAIPLSPDGDCCLAGRSSTVSYIQTPSTGMCTSTQSDGDWCPTLRHLLLLFVLPLSLMVIVVLHSDTFYCYLYFH